MFIAEMVPGRARHGAVKSMATAADKPAKPGPKQQAWTRPA